MTTYDVTGIGNAIVDVLSFTDDTTLAEQGLVKGSMSLVDEIRSEALYKQMGQTTECSGGSAANTLAGMASLGAKTAFIGKVKNDQLGHIFTHDMKAVGVHFSTTPLSHGPSTASCLVYVTPDAQRTMATYIGACNRLSENDIDEKLISSSTIIYIEGYLWDTDHAKAAIRKAISVAKKAGHRVAFTLSDVFCVDRHRKEFLELIEHDIDILFANEDELLSLYETGKFDSAVGALKGACDVAAVTRSEKGSVVITAEGKQAVPAESVSKIVDTTGAGDLYAGGFLFGLTHARNLSDCAKLGNRCAAEIITQMGARSLRPLKSLVA